MKAPPPKAITHSFFLSEPSTSFSSCNLKNSVTIWLDTNLKTLNKRIKWNKKRPLLHGENTERIIKKLYDERKNIYKLAKHKINCDNLSKEIILKKIITIYEKQ